MILTCRWIFFQVFEFFLTLFEKSGSICFHLFPSVFSPTNPQRLAVSGITSGEAFNAFASWQRTHYRLEVLGKHNTLLKN